MLSEGTGEINQIQWQANGQIDFGRKTAQPSMTPTGGSKIAFTGEGTSGKDRPHSGNQTLMQVSWVVQ
jgi:hypothetical protein